MSDIQAKHTNFHVEPLKFALWISMISMIMLFGAFTSAYIVRQGAGNWLEYVLPPTFYYSTGAIIISSFALHYSYYSFKKGNEMMYKGMLVLSFILGMIFVVLQLEAWGEMFTTGIGLKGNPSGSFLYVITGVHALHVMGGIAALVVAMIHAFTLKYKPTLKRKNRFVLVVQYWHFVDIIWVYLFLFLLFTK